MAEPYHPLQSDPPVVMEEDTPIEADAVFIQGDAGFTSQLFTDLDTPEDSLLSLENNDEAGDVITSEEGPAPAEEPTPSTDQPADTSGEDEWQANVNLKWSVSLQETEQEQMRAAAQAARVAMAERASPYRHTFQPDQMGLPRKPLPNTPPAPTRTAPPAPPHTHMGPLGMGLSAASMGQMLPDEEQPETDSDGRPLPPLSIRQRYQTMAPTTAAPSADAQDDKSWGGWLGRAFGSDDSSIPSSRAIPESAGQRPRPVTYAPQGSNRSSSPPPEQQPNAQPRPAPTAAARPETAEERRARQYDEYLQKAKQMNFDDVKKYQVIYQPGVDKFGRRIIVLVGNMPKSISLDQLFFYFISLMDPIVEKDYVIVYVHQENAPRPPLSWMRKVYGLFNRKYKKNLKQLFVVYPTFWVKTMFGLFKPFISSKFWSKLVYIQSPKTLYEHMHPDQVQLPDYTLPPEERERKLKLFGISLAAAMKHPTNVGRDTPRIVDDAIDCIEQKALQTEGIFRLSGNANRIKELKARMDSGKMPNLFEESEIHDVSGVLKLWLRELEEPLIPYPLYDTLIDAFEHPGGMSPKERVKALLWSMPLLNLIVLEKLMVVLNKITKFEKINKMSSSNLSIVFAPNLLRSESDNPAQALMHASVVPAIVKMMIEDPDDFIGSVRRLKSGESPVPVTTPNLATSAPAVAAAPAGPPRPMPPSFAAPRPVSLAALSQAQAEATPSTNPDGQPRSSRRNAGFSAVYQPVNPDQ